MHYDIICMSYIAASTNETNIFMFWPNVSKKFNKCLISNQIPKYLSTIWKYFPSSKFQVASLKSKISYQMETS